MIGAFLAPYFELADRLAAPMTVLTYPSLARLAAAFGDAAGLPEDQARFTLCLVLSYPLAALQSRLPRAAATSTDDGCALRHASHAFVGVSMLQFALGTMWIHAALAALGGWLLLRFSPDPDRAHVHVTAFILTYCSASHAYRMHADYGGWALDFTGIMMMLCVKLMSLAFNVADGRAGPGQPGADTAAGARGEDGVAGGGRVATGDIWQLGPPFHRRTGRGVKGTRSHPAVCRPVPGGHLGLEWWRFKYPQRDVPKE